jgi:zinc protease
MNVPRLLLALLLLAPVALAQPEEEPAPPERRFQLENGLDVTVRRIEGAQMTCVMVLYDVGEDHDPEGQSGLAHLVEHCYVTAATGMAPARTADEMMAAYPHAWNAQTGSDYTVFAFLVPTARWKAELAEAAARMDQLEIVQADLEREKPRMLVEVDNMFGGFPPLAAQNLARERVRPSPVGGRKGGVPEKIAALDLATVRARHAKVYKPVNARLLVVGDVAPGDMEAEVRTLFGAISPGQPVGAPRPRPEPRPGSETARPPPNPAGRAGAHLCRAWAAPRPGDPEYAPFVVLLARSWSKGNPRPGQPTFQFTPLDDPAAVFHHMAVAEGSDGTPEGATLDGELQALVFSPLMANEAATAVDVVSFFYGTSPLPDEVLAQNPYAVALGLGRRAQLGLDPERLAEAMRAVTPELYQAAMRRVFDPAKRAEVLVKPGVVSGG